jgi:hypothetical protein
LYLKIVVVKHAEQTALKQQENAVSPGAYIWRWKQQKREIMPRISCCHKHHN